MFMRLALSLVTFGLAAGLMAQQATQVAPDTFQLPTETALPVIESTARYFPQIQHRYEARLKLPENPKWMGQRTAEEPNTLPLGGLLNEPRGSLLARFPGITATGWNPPDPHLAAGPNHLVAVVNSSLAFFTKTGTATFQVDFGTFFSTLSPGNFIFDPKVIYDVHANRFVVIVLEQDDATQTSKVLFAISDDSDPNGTWFKYRLEAKATIGSVVCWGDYPGFGYNKDGYAIALNMFPFASGPAPGIQVMAIRKSSVISGGAAVVTKFLNTASDSFSIQVAENLNASSDKVFMVNAATTTKLKVWTMGGLAGTPTAPTTQNVTVSSYEFPTGFGWECKSPGSRILDGLDSRLVNVYYRGTRLLTTHSFEAATDARSRVRWYEMSLPAAGGTASVVQSGEIKEPGTTERHYFMPAIAKNAANDIAVVFTKSGAAGPVADIMFSARKASDAAGAMGTPVLLKSSETNPYGSSGFNRWGDYAAICVDPADNGTFWMIHMTGGSGFWTTEISKAAVSPVITDITFPATVFGGGPAITADFTLNGPVAASTPVSVSSSNGSLASPSGTTVAAGASSGSFTIATPTGVDANTSVTIVATINGVSFSKSLIIRPANLSNMTLNFSTIAANQSVIATVTLNGKAGPAGRVVTTSSSAPIAVVQPTMTVAGGATTGKFGISTANTNVTQTANITATLGIAVTRTLTVIKAPTLSSLEIAAPKSVKGGLSTSCLVRTLEPAPAGGARAKLLESSPFVDPNVYANIAAGLKVGSATIRTSPVTTTQVVVITARMNGINKTDTLTVTP